jgi:endonuclease/exonuclease/phosphatase family metal-dependent hydrolase
MADRAVGRLWKAFAAGCCLASSVVWLAGATAASPATGVSSRGRGPTGATGATMRVLQLNLCDSGIAPCYTGRSVEAAAAVIRTNRPDIVTLNEVCGADVSGLRRAMADSHPNTVIASAFRAAVDRATNRPFRCRNGQQYGIGVLAVIRSSAGSAYRTFGGVYPSQDVTDPEERVWLCIHSARDFYACSTHAASTSRLIALAQCRYFLATAVPIMRGEEGADPVILGADLNLQPGHSPDAQSCLPAGYQRADDGSRQDIVTSPGVALGSRAVIDMHGTTDHPGLLVGISRRR